VHAHQVVAVEAVVVVGFLGKMSMKRTPSKSVSTAWKRAVAPLSSLMSRVDPARGVFQREHEFVVILGHPCAQERRIKDGRAIRKQGLERLDVTPAERRAGGDDEEEKGNVGSRGGHVTTLTPLNSRLYDPRFKGRSACGVLPVLFARLDRDGKHVLPVRKRARGVGW